MYRSNVFDGAKIWLNFETCKETSQKLTKIVQVKAKMHKNWVKSRYNLQFLAKKFGGLQEIF